MAPGAPAGTTLRQVLAEAISGAAGFGPDHGATAQELVSLVGTTARAEDEVGHLLREAVGSARSGGASWGSIGRELGMSRQAAQQRFGRPGETGPGGLAEASTLGDRRVLGPVTALTEMDELRLAGRLGWHSVGFSAFQHVVEQSDTQWEHRRVAVFGPARAALERDGWQVIGSWFPWVYLKRTTGAPALSHA